MRGIKIPQQDFPLKMPRGGGLCARGGVFAGHYGICLAQYHYLLGELECFFLFFVSGDRDRWPVAWFAQGSGLGCISCYCSLESSQGYTWL